MTHDQAILQVLPWPDGGAPAVVDVSSDLLQEVQASGVVKCQGCPVSFEPRRKDQRYHSAKCRQDHYAATVGDGALRGAVSRVSLLKGGKVSIVTTFLPMDRDSALQIIPGTMVEIVRQ